MAQSLKCGGVSVTAKHRERPVHGRRRLIKERIHADPPLGWTVEVKEPNTQVMRNRAKWRRVWITIPIVVKEGKRLGLWKDLTGSLVKGPFAATMVKARS
jgi:hypothetical protein